jgi:mannonate dehydratase
MPDIRAVGGKCREAVDTYAHAEGSDSRMSFASAKRMQQGFRNVRVRWECPECPAMARGQRLINFKPLDKPFLSRLRYAAFT